MNPQRLGYFGLLLVMLIILAVLAGCQAPKASSFSATCALVIIGQNEQGITFVKQHCEVE